MRVSHYVITNDKQYLFSNINMNPHYGDRTLLIYSIQYNLIRTSSLLNTSNSAKQTLLQFFGSEGIICRQHGDDNGRKDEEKKVI